MVKDNHKKDVKNKKLNKNNNKLKKWMQIYVRLNQFQRCFFK